MQFSPFEWCSSCSLRFLSLLPLRQSRHLNIAVWVSCLIRTARVPIYHPCTYIHIFRVRFVMYSLLCRIWMSRYHVSLISLALLGTWICLLKSLNRRFDFHRMFMDMCTFFQFNVFLILLLLHHSHSILAVAYSNGFRNNDLSFCRIRIVEPWY